MAQLADVIRQPNGLLNVATGTVQDVKALNIFGFNRTVETSWETVWNDGGIYSYPTSAVQMDVDSTSAADTMQLSIAGLDANYHKISETVTLNGTTAVTTTQSFLRINSAIILSGENAGDIEISEGGTKYGWIEAGLGTTQALNHTIPAGHALYIYRIDFNSGTVNPNKYLIVRNHLVSSTGRVLNVAESTFQTGELSVDRQVPFRIPEKTDFSFQARSSSSTNEISIFVEAIEVKE